MTAPVDLYHSTYRNIAEQVMADVRQATYGQDLGQNSWITAEEYDGFGQWVGLAPGRHVLEVASGAGGPALHLARKFGCRVTGIDLDENGVAAANQAALAGHTPNAYFQSVDAAADRGLPFESETFDALLCMDALNHFRDRPAVFQEWARVLKPGGRLVCTDPVVITGPISNEELAQRSAIGFFLFVPAAQTEAWLAAAGLRLARCDDVTENAALLAGRWHAARQKHAAALTELEGAERFAGLQTFAWAVHTLSRERRLSRLAFLAEKPARSAQPIA
jgi:SAM-dependent methyltransferase